MGDFQGHPFRGNQWTGTSAYIGGDRAEHTGRSRDMYGTTFHEVKIVEGRRAGELAMVSERQRAELADALTPVKPQEVTKAPVVAKGDYLASGQGQGQPVSDIPRRAKLGEVIKGHTFGTAIVGYDWRSRIEDVESAREGSVARRVSDWDRSDTSTGTGREIVHVFYVKHADGSVTAEGIGSAQRILGLSVPRLRTVASHARDAGVRREREEASMAESYERGAKESRGAAARDMTDRSAGAVKSMTTEQFESWQSSGVFLEKGGKWLKVDASRADALESRGWKRG